jgi:hypothetical protein
MCPCVVRHGRRDQTWEALSNLGERSKEGEMALEVGSVRSSVISAPLAS